MTNKKIFTLPVVAAAFACGAFGYYWGNINQRTKVYSISVKSQGLTTNSVVSTTSSSKPAQNQTVVTASQSAAVSKTISIPVIKKSRVSPSYKTANTANSAAAHVAQPASTPAAPAPVSPVAQTPVATQVNNTQPAQTAPQPTTGASVVK